jgi:hypothetical protein
MKANSTQAVIAIGRDVLSMALGAFIVINEELSGKVHIELLTVAAALLGLPSVAALLSLRGNKQTQDTREPSSSSASGSP